MTEAGAGRLRPSPWFVAEVREVVPETRRVRTVLLDVPGWPGHRPGQHVSVRLTGDDGYEAQRDYSIASAPETPGLALTVERIDDGEVSPYLVDELQPGDRFSLRGPIGGYFVWTVADGGPLFLVAGGSGIVPLMAMLRHRAAAGNDVPSVLLYSSRSLEDVIYREELRRLAADDDHLRVIHTLTRSHPPDWSGPTRRIDPALIVESGIDPSAKPHVFVCGPTPMVEAAARALVAQGHAPERIKTERFGPTGG